MNMKINAKAWVAAVGATLTAVTASWASVTTTFSDNVVDAAEVGTILTAALSLVGTVIAVWRVPNEKRDAE